MKHDAVLFDGHISVVCFVGAFVNFIALEPVEHIIDVTYVFRVNILVGPFSSSILFDFLLRLFSVKHLHLSVVSIRIRSLWHVALKRFFEQAVRSLGLLCWRKHIILLLINHH